MRRTDVHGYDLTRETDVHGCAPARETDEHGVCSNMWNLIDGERTVPNMALEKIDIATLDPKRTIVVATGNAHKLTEIEAILSEVLPEVRFCGLGSARRLRGPQGDGHHVRGERDHQGRGCGCGHRPCGNRRRLRPGGGCAGRRAGCVLGALCRCARG